MTTLQDDVASSVNGTGTFRKIGSPVTQSDSLNVHALRKSLDALRAKHGADTPIGHRCSNLIEQLKSYQNSTPEQRANLEKFIALSVADLARLSSDGPKNAEDRGDIHG